METSKKIQNISIIAMAIFVFWFIVLLVADNAMAKNEDSDSKQIANYEYQINELRKQKEQCYNDLTYEESKQAYEWFTKPCVQWDEEIMIIRAKADELKAKSYEGLR